MILWRFFAFGSTESGLKNREKTRMFLFKVLLKKEERGECVEDFNLLLDSVYSLGWCSMT